MLSSIETLVALVLCLLASQAAQADYDVTIPSQSFHLQTSDGHPLAGIPVRTVGWHQKLVFSENGCMSSNGHAGVFALPGFCYESTAQFQDTVTTDENGNAVTRAQRLAGSGLFTRANVDIDLHLWLPWGDHKLDLEMAKFDLPRTTVGPNYGFPCAFLDVTASQLKKLPAQVLCTLADTWADLEQKAAGLSSEHCADGGHCE